MSQIVKPFVGKVRYAPDVASRPERMVKDLANAKALVSLMEEEAASLRKEMHVLPTQESNGDNAPVNGTSTDDAATADSSGFHYEEDPEPRERGSDAVERRIERIMSELRDQGQFAGCSDDELEAKRVSHWRAQKRPVMITLIRLVDCDCVGPVHCVSSCSVSHMLLLRSSYGSSRGIAAQMCEACKKTSVERAQAGVESSGRAKR